MKVQDIGSFSKALLDAAPEPILVADAEGRIVLVNDRTLAVFGLDREEILGQTIEALVPERFREAHLKHRHQYNAQPQVRGMGAGGTQLWGRRKDGSEFPIDVSLSPFRNDEGRFVIAILRDVSHRMVVEERLRHMSTHDALTGLYNRAFFDEELARLDRGRVPVGVVIADLDALKVVNDQLGHEHGDRLIQDAAAAISQVFRAEDVVARLGGDEFAILVPGIKEHELAQLLGRLRPTGGSSAPEISASGDSLALRLSLGSSIGQPGQLAQAMRAADAAMYADKRARRAQPDKANEIR